MTAPAVTEAPAITPAWVRTMAGYNAEMNRRVYTAAGRLDEAERRRDRGAFFGSIHATLNHLLWADQMWMSRFAGWEKPMVGMREGLETRAAFADLRAARVETDGRIGAWADGLDEAWLRGDLTWFSGVTQTDVTRSRALLVTHMFNHQTHHRGQIHAMLTAAGERTGDTDLWIVAV
jgi:uncharacterized damage-inducible protein DinB